LDFTLVEGVQLARYHKVMLDAKDLSTGVYCCGIRAEDFVRAKRLVLAK
jgi:hypothetical protein